MIYTILICLGFLLYGFYLIKIRKQSVIQPNVLLILVMGFTILLSCFKLSGLQHDFNLVFNVSILLFLLSYIFAFSFSKKIKLNNNYERKYKKNRFKIMTFILFSVVVLSFLITWKILGTPPGFGGSVSRSQYYVGKLEGIYVLIYFLIYCILYDRFQNKYLGKMYWLYTIIIIFLILARANKFTLFYYIIIYITLYNNYKKKISIKHLFILLICSLGVFVGSFNLIYNKMYNSLSDRVIGYEMKLPENLYFITDMYTYVAFNYENINYYMGLENHNLTFGYYSFSSINDIIGFDKFYKNNVIISNEWSSNLQYKSLTTGSILRDFYLDFSYFGIFFGGCIIGIISGIANKMYSKNNNNIFTSYIYILVIFGIFMSFFTNFFSNIIFLINIIMAKIFDKIVSFKE